MMVNNEIIVSKLSLYKQFKTSHGYLQQRLRSHEEGSELESNYYNLLVYLLTTNENHTVLKLHEGDFWNIYNNINTAERTQWLRQEFRFILGILNSRSSKLNKSSSLWFWMKKLCIANIFNNKTSSVSVDDDFHMLIECMALSCKLHFANYYCHGFIKWVAVVTLAMRSSMIDTNAADASLMNIYQSIKQLAMAHLQDVSLWTTLGLLIRLLAGDIETRLQSFVLEEYNMIVDQCNILDKYHQYDRLNQSTGINIKLIKKEVEYSDLRHYLDTVQCHYKTPYTILNGLNE